MTQQVGLTPAQQNALDFIRTFIKDKGYSPSIREIGEGIGIKSGSAVHRIVNQLKERGFIVSVYRRARSIAVIDDQGEVLAGARNQPADRVVQVAREICRERCAAYGDPPCWREDIDPNWTGECDTEADCLSLARAAVIALDAMKGSAS